MDIIPFIVAMVLILFGTVLGCMLLWKLAMVIQHSIKKNNTVEHDEAFDRLALAFIQFKKDMERRMTNVEAIIANNDDEVSSQTLNEPTYKSIEIDESESMKENQNKGSNMSNNLRTE